VHLIQEYANFCQRDFWAMQSATWPLSFRF